MELCKCYDINWYDIIVPTNYLFYRLCYRADKTKMFLITVIRIIIFIGVFSILYNYNLIAVKSGFPLKIFSFWVLAMYLLANIVSLGLVVLKINVLDEKAIEKEVTELAEDKLKKYKIVVTDDHSYKLI